MQLFDVYPLYDITITDARGSRVYDDNGQEYLDLYGGHAVISIGHTHPHYVNRLTSQLNRVGFYSNSVHIPGQVELATELGRVSGREDFQLFLCNSGAEANENALKLASFYNGRKKVVAFSKSFHGRTSLAVAATDNPAIVAPVNAGADVQFLPFNDTEALEAFFKDQGDSVSSVIVENIQGVGGIHVATAPFIRTIRRLCDTYNAVFIADEVQCGYGRSGKFYAQDHTETSADIYTMAKGMGNGFPVGGISIAPKLQPKFGMLGTTFGGNHLACAAGLAVLEVIAKERLMEHAASLGKYWMDELRKFKEIKEVRGEGLMIGLELGPEWASLRKNLLFKHHIFTGESKPHVIRLLPALNLDRADADRFLEALNKEFK